MASLDIWKDEDFNTIRANALHCIADYQKEWTNYNTSDTGIALLELLAWMQEMQQFYFRQYSVMNEVLYQELLGIEPEGLTPAAVIVCVENSQEETLYPNTGFYVDTICYEPIYREQIGMGILCKCYAQDAENHLLWQCRGTEEIKRGVWMFGEQPAAEYSFYMGFSKAVQTARRYSMFLELLPSEAGIRNPVQGDRRELFARFCLESWNGIRWCPCRILRDETAGFIQSGFLDWMPEEEQKAVEELYWLRIRLLSCQYDIPPKLAAVDTQRVKLLQKETVAASVQLLLPVSRAGSYCIDLNEYFDTPEKIELFVKQEEGYRRIRNWKQEENRLTFFYKGMAESLFTVLLVVQNGRSKAPLEWEATGFPGQIICLDDVHIMKSRMQVLVEDEEKAEVYHFWNPVTHFWGCEADQRCYCYQEETGQLQFGDGIHGRIPEGRILVTDCVRTMGEAGRIQERKQLHWKGGNAYNPTAAQGGHNGSSREECREQFWKQEQKQRCAVTLKDYEQLVMQTPGLLIRRVKAVSEAGEKNGITLIIEGGDRRRGRSLHPVYQREIRRWLEERRIMGTRIRLEAPDYIPIRIYTEVRVYERYHKAEVWIRETLEQYVREALGGFGAGLNYSHLYGTLDSLNCIREIQTLTVYASGKGIQFTGDGSFRLPDRALAVLEEIQIQLIQETGGR